MIKMWSFNMNICKLWQSTFWGTLNDGHRVEKCRLSQLFNLRADPEMLENGSFQMALDFELQGYIRGGW